MITNIADQLLRDEGIRLKMYRDSVGVWTIGVGHNLEAKPISTRAAQMILGDDIEDARQELYQALPWTATLDSVRLGVLLNMAFNLGAAGVLAFKKMLVHIQASEWDNAAYELVNSTYATQVGPRAHRLALQLTTGVWQ